LRDKKLKLVLFLLLFWGGECFAQTVEEVAEKAPPQILTSDLTRKQVLKKPEKVVSFIIVDDDMITEVIINGESLDFEADTTLSFTRKFIFKPGKTIISVIAIDERGNKREKSFLIGFGKTGEQAIAAEKKEKKSQPNFKVQFGLAYERDGNPTNDVSSPVKIGDLDLQGVVPDSEQPDNRKTLNLLGSWIYGDFNLFLGASKTVYDKSKNEFLNSKIAFLGLGYALTFSNSFSLPVSLMVMDINVGGSDFSQNIALSTGLLFRSKDEDGFYSHLLDLDGTVKLFADKTKKQGSQNQIKWDYNSLDIERLDNFRYLLAIGLGNNGTEISENSYVAMDFDWTNQWESGFKWDLGFGLAKIEYKNEVPLTKKVLGNVRVDVPIRISNGFGWAFSSDWKVVYDYRYLFNLSNKTPYVRIIHGLKLNGGF